MTRYSISMLATAAVAACRLLTGEVAAQGVSKPRAADSETLAEVQVTAPRLMDRRTLDHVIVPLFVESHGEPSVTINQIGRWREGLCPTTTGLLPDFNAFVSRKVLAVAGSVGAPAPVRIGKCTINVEIAFTPTPQQLLDHIAKSYPRLLGMQQGRRITRAVQAWYLTGTRSMIGAQRPVAGLNGPNIDAQAATALSPIINGVQADSEFGSGLGGLGPSGMAGSHLSKGLSSEFLHVLVIVDAGAVAEHPLGAVSDYIAMLALTRMASLDTCSALPSIIDLFSATCRMRAPPDALTQADAAFLKALYASDLEQNLNIERGDLHDRMLTGLTGH
ncbi:MAG TPA: hypothetical protein VMG11_02830 [Steroidobacteraceae bacterium]|nr:hypothetical protein [Steroidobacteraceae bacterium]